MSALVHSGFVARSLQRFKSASTQLFVASRSAFESGQVTQALRDILALLSVGLLFISTGFGVAFALFFLLCVRC